MDDDQKNPHLTAKGIIHGLIIGFAAWMVVLVVILIAIILSREPEDNTFKKNETNVYTTENHR